MADDEIKVRKERDPILVTCFIVFLIAVGMVSGATIFNSLQSDATQAVTGNTVEVNYIGTFYAPFGETNAVVFDTSKWSVADDDKIVKSNDFTPRKESDYKPLSFKVGGTDVLMGFGNAVIGAKVGDTVKVMIPRGEGYNAQDSTTTVNATLTFSMPATEILTMSQFKELYGFELKANFSIAKSVYGWPAEATFNSASNTVTMHYTPTASTTYTAVDSDFGKMELKVSSVSGASISYTYVISGFTVVSTEGTAKNIQMIMVDFGTQKYYITSVVDANNDGVAESFTYRNVAERYNIALYFEIEIVSIK